MYNYPVIIIIIVFCYFFYFRKPKKKIIIKSWYKQNKNKEGRKKIYKQES